MNAPSRRCLAWLLLSAMVLWQLLGLIHGAVHLDGGRSAHGVTHEQAALRTQPPVAGSWLAQLFADHAAGSGDCRLLDHLSNADPVPALASSTCPTLFPTAFTASRPVAIAARTRLPFAARGPPFSA